jgi:hypothetical protein
MGYHPSTALMALKDGRQTLDPLLAPFTIRIIPDDALEYRCYAINDGISEVDKKTSDCVPYLSQKVLGLVSCADCMYNSLRYRSNLYLRSSVGFLN